MSTLARRSLRATAAAAGIAAIGVGLASPALAVEDTDTTPRQDADTVETADAQDPNAEQTDAMAKESQAPEAAKPSNPLADLVASLTGASKSQAAPKAPAAMPEAFVFEVPSMNAATPTADADATKADAKTADAKSAEAEDAKVTEPADPDLASQDAAKSDKKSMNPDERAIAEAKSKGEAERAKSEQAEAQGQASPQAGPAPASPAAPALPGLPSMGIPALPMG